MESHGAIRTYIALKSPNRPSLVEIFAKINRQLDFGFGKGQQARRYNRVVSCFIKFPLLFMCSIPNQKTKVACSNKSEVIRRGNLRYCE